LKGCIEGLNLKISTSGETVEKVETFIFGYSRTVKNQLLRRQWKWLIRGFKGFSTVSEEVVTLFRKVLPSMLNLTLSSPPTVHLHMALKSNDHWLGLA
jgi:hypothetical protein